MQQQLSPMRKRLACLGLFGLLLLSFLLVGLLVLGLFSHRISDAIVMAIYMLGLGIFWFLRSSKKYRERRSQGRSVTWYTQLGLLFALALLLTMPFYIVVFLTEHGFSKGKKREKPVMQAKHDGLAFSPPRTHLIPMRTR